MSPLGLSAEIINPLGETRDAKSPEKPKHRKFGKIKLSKRFQRKLKIQTTSEASPQPSLTFSTARQLHKERGYDAFDFKKIMKKRKRKEPTLNAEKTSLEEITPATTKLSEKGPNNQISQQILPETLINTEVEPREDVVGEKGEDEVSFKEKRKIIDLLEDSSHKIYLKVKPAMHWSGEKIKGGLEHVKWFMGWATRGNITKRLQKIHESPQNYKEELEAELERSLVNAINPENDSFAKRNRKNIIQGFATLSTILPAWIPTGLPIPFSLYTGGSIVVSIDNVVNTAIALHQKRFRKGLAYGLMTLGGVATGFFPGAHNLTNTWYTELLQKTYDHAESEGMLKIIHALFNPNTSSENRILGQQTVSKALIGTYEKTNVLLLDPAQLDSLSQIRQGEKEKLLQEMENIKERHNQLPGFFRGVLHPSQILHNLNELRKIALESINLQQQLIDIEHKLRTIPQLSSILTSLTESNLSTPSI